MNVSNWMQHQKKKLCGVTVRDGPESVKRLVSWERGISLSLIHMHLQLII